MMSKSTKTGSTIKIAKCCSPRKPSPEHQSIFAKLCSCMVPFKPEYKSTLLVRSLTCDKLSHCLFDFDCPDLSVYERETYNFQEMVISDLKQASKNDQSHPEKAVHDIVLCREGIKVWHEHFVDSDTYHAQAKNHFMRILFEPVSQSIWGFHQIRVKQSKKKKVDECFSPTEPNGGADSDDENDVDMSKTMWMVLKKGRPQNPTLKNFDSDTSCYTVKYKDIIKFGRVNFKISAINSKKLSPEYQGGYLNNQTFKYQSQATQHAPINQLNERNLLSHTSVNVTDMNLLDATMLNHSTNLGKNQQMSPQKITQMKKAKTNDDMVPLCRICLGEEDEDNNNELICPCKCSGTMQYIHVECLREWMNGKKLIYNGERVKSFFWKALECELCKTPYENKMKDQLFQIMDFERPNAEYMIMESVKSAPAKVIHVYYLDRSNEFRIGRSVETDMKIADISVSRLHSYIRIRNGQLFIEDNGSKFGTLLRVKEPMDIVQSCNLEKQSAVFQVGRSLLYFGIQSTGKPSKKPRKSKQIQVEFNQHRQGFVMLNSGTFVPQQFVERKTFERFENNVTQRQVSQNFQLSKPPSGRSNILESQGMELREVDQEHNNYENEEPQIEGQGQVNEYQDDNLERSQENDDEDESSNDGNGLEEESKRASSVAPRSHRIVHDQRSNNNDYQSIINIQNDYDGHMRVVPPLNLHKNEQPSSVNHSSRSYGGQANLVVNQINRNISNRGIQIIDKKLHGQNVKKVVMLQSHQNNVAFKYNTIENPSEHVRAADSKHNRYKSLIVSTPYRRVNDPTAQEDMPEEGKQESDQLQVDSEKRPDNVFRMEVVPKLSGRGQSAGRTNINSRMQKKELVRESTKTVDFNEENPLQCIVMHRRNQTHGFNPVQSRVDEKNFKESGENLIQKRVSEIYLKQEQGPSQDDEFVNL